MLIALLSLSLGLAPEPAGPNPKLMSGAPELVNAAITSLQDRGKSDRFGEALDSAGDVDRDGVADVIVGAPGDDFNGANSGAAVVFSGRTGKPIWSMYGSDSESHFGDAVAGVGDVDKDGFADIAIGAPTARGKNGAKSGRVWLFSGRNGKALFSLTGSTEDGLFGGMVAACGDVDRDGRPDVVIGAVGDNSRGNGSGAAFVHSGRNGALLYSFYGDSPTDAFGSVGGAGDVNKDGHDDIIVAASNDGNNGEASGSVCIFSGMDGSRLYIWNGDTAGDFLGERVHGAGDVNGDGYADVIAGAYDAETKNGTNSGMARVFSGRDGSILHTFIGEKIEDMMGGYVGGAADVNGDGHSDLLVGNYGANGRTLLHSGRDGAVLLAFRSAQIEGSQLGVARGVGDVDGDRTPDILIGDTGGFTSNRPGLARIYSGKDGSIIRTLQLLSPEESKKRNEIKYSAAQAAIRETIKSMRRSTGIKNGGFEDGSVGAVPTHWIAAINPRRGTTAAAGVKGEIVAGGAAEGKKCAVVQLGGNPAANAYSVLIQSLDAAPFRGCRVRLRGLLKAETVDGLPPAIAHLWLRVELSEGRIGFFDNTRERPVSANAWTAVEIVGDIADDAQFLNLGVYGPVGNRGRLWVDAISLEILGKTPITPSMVAKPLGESQLGNIVAFVKALGYIRFFHPTTEAAKADWDEIGRLGVVAVEDARSPKELAGRLQKLFAPFAPSARFLVAGQSANSLKAPTGALRAVRWKHHGVGLGGGPGYASMREYSPIATIPTSWRPPTDPLVLELGSGVRIALPTTCYVGPGNQTLPRATARFAAPKPATVMPKPTVGTVKPPPDRAERLAAIGFAWNVMQHFYPNFDDIRVDWPLALRSALQQVAAEQAPSDYQRAMQAMIAKLEDGHGYVGGSWQDAHRPGIELEWVGEELVICGLHDSVKPEFTLGEVVLAVDGVPASQRANSLAPYIPASTPHRNRLTQAQRLLMGPATPVALTVRGADGAVRTVSVERRGYRTAPREPRPNLAATELKPGIWYLDVGLLKPEDLSGTIKKLEPAKAIIIDVRGYPNFPFQGLFAHFTKRELETPPFLVPQSTQPNRSAVEMIRGSWSIQPSEPFIPARLIFLTDARAISNAELMMDFVEYYKMGDIVGGPTAGTDGNVNPFEVGGLSIMWTGMKVPKHDGSPLNGVGILPTVPVQRTIEGIRAGRDEVLERALDLVVRK